MNWLEQYLDCVLRVDGAEETFRQATRQRAARLQNPRCQFRAADAVCAGAEMWDLFTARADIHAVADAMLELDGIEYTQLRRTHVSAA